MLRYKRQFGRELLPDLLKIYSLFPALKGFEGEDKDEMTREQKVQLAQVVLSAETEWMYDIAFIMAQQADPSITDELTWLDSFDDLNILSIFVQLMPLLRLEQQVSLKNA